MLPWFNTAYLFRRQIELSSPDGAPIGHTVGFPLVFTDKERPDLEDIEIIYVHPNGSTSPLGHLISLPATPGTMDIEFPLFAPLAPGIVDSNYFVYHGNFHLTDIPLRPTYVPSTWPISVGFDDLGISYTRPGEHWEKGVSAIKNAVATYVFYAASVQLVSTTGPDQGIIISQMDQSPKIRIDLYSPFTTAGVVVYEWDGLDDSNHVLALQTSGLKNPGSSRFTINIVGFNLTKFITVKDDGEEISDQLSWTSSLGGGN